MINNNRKKKNDKLSKNTSNNVIRLVTRIERKFIYDCQGKSVYIEKNQMQKKAFSSCILLKSFLFYQNLSTVSSNIFFNPIQSQDQNFTKFY